MFENSQENVYYEVYFSKVAKLHLYYNKLHYRFFSKYVQKTSDLKRVFWEKGLSCTSVLIRL